MTEPPGCGKADLLGIAPGATYRLVVPQQPTTDQIAIAMLAAARQSPRPNVIWGRAGCGSVAVFSAAVVVRAIVLVDLSRCIDRRWRSPVLLWRAALPLVGGG